MPSNPTVTHMSINVRHKLQIESKEIETDTFVAAESIVRISDMPVEFAAVDFKSCDCRMISFFF